MAGTSYTEFLERKRPKQVDAGFAPEETPDDLYPFQAHIYGWALRKGRCAVFADCGLGKTPIQLFWADAVVEHSGGNILIAAPLAVAKQTQREGYKFGVPVTVCRTQDDVRDGINVTNYEMLQHFDASKFGGLVLDESSILKAFSGKYRTFITEFAQAIKYRLACTATPAPNDLIEIINHAEFLDVMTGKEAIGMFFKQDGNTTHKWRLKGHAYHAFWRWVGTWAMAVQKPSDIGFDDGAFVLPELKTTQHTVQGHVADGFLFPVHAQTLQEQREAKRESLDDRVALCADMVNASTDPWVVWCNMNNESDALRRAIPDAVEVKGSDPLEQKEARLEGFAKGEHRVIVTKPSIAGFGLNWQHCHNMAFVGLSHSFEQMYQAIRRCWRFGQTQPVNCHVVVAETEGEIVSNIKRKEAEAHKMYQEIVRHMNGGNGRA